MGGFGSGRHGGKSTTEDMLSLDIRRLARNGLLKPGQSFNWKWSYGGKAVGNININTSVNQVTLNYRVRDQGDEWHAMDYPVCVTWTPCTYGGLRAWFICPAVGCGRRVAILYGGKVYACRHCHQLAYRTQREQAYDRAGSKAEKLRSRLRWEPGILNGNGLKPKGMHWSTFERLQAHHDSLVSKSLTGVIAKFTPRGALLDVP